ncbi:MAG: hypothetical protein LBL61_04950 [Elusimicrobiota bacterium]|jgi:hypothetical protein|nr:hypothetical protein [Elusimicrobiota bacterium]
MKKFILSISIFIFLCAAARAEAVKLKNGVIINGSIVGQTEYVISVQTDYGTIAINQREVDSIMPDLHRVLMKGGGEFVGTVMDMDEFNLTLKTDNGIVNLDVAQIASMEIYDYGEAEKQKKYVEKKIELEQEAMKAMPDAAASPITAAEVAAGGTLSTSGLSFDPDLEKAFPSKPAVVEAQQAYNYHLNTFQGQEIKENAAPAEPAPPAPEEEETVEQDKVKDKADNYVAVSAGAVNTKLKLGNLSDDPSAQIQEADLGGNAMAFGVEYRHRLGTHLWAGANLSFGLIPKKYAIIVPDKHEMKVTGQIINLDLLLNYYFNPKSKTRFYMLAGGGGSFLSLDKNNAVKVIVNNIEEWVTAQTDSVSSTSVAAMGGIGVERSVQDINIGFELRAHYVPYGGDLEGSRKTNIFALLKASWFF